MWFRQTHGVRLTVGRSGAVPARSRAAAGKDPEREGGRDGRAGDAPLDRASTTVGGWTRAVTSPRLDRPHQLDGAGQAQPALAAQEPRPVRLGGVVVVDERTGGPGGDP